MTDHDSGVYVLQVYASSAGQDSSAVLQNYVSRYGDAAVSELGSLSNGTNIQSVAKSVAQSNMSSASPSKVDFTQAFLDAGGSVSFTKAAVQGVEEAGSEIASTAWTGLKWVTVAAVAIAVIYAAKELGWLNRGISKIRA